MPQSRPPSGSGPHPLDYLKVLHKRRWTAVSVFSTVLIVGTLYTFTATPIYEARATLLIEAETQNIVSFKEAVQQEQTRADYYQTQYNLLQSRSLARRTVGVLNLAGGQLSAAAPQGGVLQAIRRAVGATLEPFQKNRSSSAGRSAPAVPPADATQVAVDALLGELSVTPVRSSRLVAVSYRSTDPDLAMRIVNAHTKGYIEQTLEFKFLTSKEAADWLGERLAEQRTQVEAAESAVQRYRETHGGISFDDGQNIVVQKLAALNAAVTTAKTERIQKEALYNQVRAVQRTGAAVDAVPAILGDAFIRRQKADLAQLQSEYAQLSEKLGNRHPEIVKVRSAIDATQSKLQAEIAKVVEGVGNEYLAAAAQERSLMEALEQQKSEALVMNRRAIEYGVLVREAESTRQVYDSLLQRAKETGISSELRRSNARIVDAAERPALPVSPSLRRNLLLVSFCGAVLAVLIALAADRLDDRIRTMEEIKTRLSLVPLGLVPAVGAKALGNATTALMDNGAPPIFSEALRTIRTNVLFSCTKTGAKSVVVTSARAAEGKSTVAANLAIGFAQTGQRVLLIDADLRRARLHALFGRSQEPGLSNLILGNVKASDVVHRTPVRNLWLLPAGKPATNAAELLGSLRFRELLCSLDDHFDWIVLDSPPVMAVADAALLAHSSTAVLFVIGMEMTNPQTALIALEQLSKASARVIGAVLNRVDLQRNAYYFSHYYRKEYANYQERPVARG